MCCSEAFPKSDSLGLDTPCPDVSLHKGQEKGITQSTSPPPLVVRTLSSFRPPGRSSNCWFRPGPSGRPVTRYRLCPSWLYLISVPLCTCLERSNVTALCLDAGSCKIFPDPAKFGVPRSRSDVHRWCSTWLPKWCSDFVTQLLSCSVDPEISVS